MFIKFETDNHVFLIITTYIGEYRNREATENGNE